MTIDLVKHNNHIAISRGFDTEEFGRVLEEAIQSRRKPKWRKKESFAPSGLAFAGACPRKWYYAFHGAVFRDESDGPSVMNMDAGSDAGKRIAKVLEDAGILVEAERKVIHNDPPIFGFIDAVVKWKGEEILCEVKTTKSEQWNVRASNFKVPGYQLIQLLIYMYLENKERGFFLTENKNDNRILIIPIRATPEYRVLVEYVLDWMREVKKASDEDKLPERAFEKTSMNCKGCSFKDQCWEGWKKATKTRELEDPAPGVIQIAPLELPK